MLLATKWDTTFFKRDLPTYLPCITLRANVTTIQIKPVDYEQMIIAQYDIFIKKMQKTLGIYGSNFDDFPNLAT